MLQAPARAPFDLPCSLVPLRSPMPANEIYIEFRWQTDKHGYVAIAKVPRSLVEEHRRQNKDERSPDFDVARDVSETLVKHGLASLNPNAIGTLQAAPLEAEPAWTRERPANFEQDGVSVWLAPSA
jgi:hypothetical protein